MEQIKINIIQLYFGINLYASNPNNFFSLFLEEWFLNGACDGFNIMPPLLPSGLDEFVNLIVPELQKRKLFRTEYTGHTLRDHLGLLRPANKFTKIR